MANVKSIQKKAGVRVWAAVSRGVNNPNIANPSEWLVEELLKQFPADQVSDRIWVIARRTLRLKFPGLDRPLGSCYRPWTADVLDIGYHYGRETQRVFRRVASAAAEIVHAGEGLWLVVDTAGDEYSPAGTYYTPSTARPKGAHISECPRLLGQLAEAVREGRAPTPENICPQFFENGWSETRIEEVRRDTEAKEKFAPIAELLAELKVSLFETEAPAIGASERWYDQYHCPNGRHTNLWFTDGRKTEVSYEGLEKPHGYFVGGGRCIVVLL